MENKGVAGLIFAFGSIITLATIAVLVSQRAQTGSIIQALASGTSSVIGAAVAPVVGNNSGG